MKCDVWHRPLSTLEQQGCPVYPDHTNSDAVRILSLVYPGQRSEQRRKQPLEACEEKCVKEEYC